MKKGLIVEVGVIRVVVVVLQLIFLKLYSNHTSVYELGIYYFLFTLSYSLNAFLLVPLDYFQQSRLYQLKNDSSSLKSFYGINIWVLKSTAIVLVLSLILCWMINPKYLGMIPVIIMLSLSTYFVTLFRGVINNLERRRLAIYTLLAEGVLKIACYSAYSSHFGSSAKTILFAILSASIFTLLGLAIIVVNIKEFKISKINLYKYKDIIAFSYPISIGAVINWVQLQGYRMILVPLGLVEIVGIYGTIANVGTSGMGALSTIYSQLFTPDLYKSNGKYIKTYLKYALVSIIGVLAVSYLFSEHIISILTKANFAPYSSIIVYGVISEGGNFLIGGLTIYLTIKNLTKYSIKASLTGLATFLVSFSALYLLKIINVYTIGLPIVITQIIITLYLSMIVYKTNLETEFKNSE